MALPRRRQCRITDALPCLDYREHYRQAVLIVEMGVLRVPECVRCSLNSRNEKVFGGFTGMP